MSKERVEGARMRHKRSPLLWLVFDQVRHVLYTYNAYTYSYNSYKH